MLALLRARSQLPAVTAVGSQLRFLRFFCIFQGVDESGLWQQRKQFALLLLQGCC